MRTSHVLLIIAGVLIMVSCEHPPVGPSPSPGPGPSPPGSVTLSGGIFEVLPDGARRSIGARQVAVEVEVSSPTDPQRGGWVPVGADGRYRLSGVPDGRFVKISAVDTPNRLQYRFCATNTITGGDTVLDVLLFMPGAAVPTPTLSGQVFTMIDGTRVPLPLFGPSIYFQSRAFGPDVVEGTDSEGRYTLCGIPPIPGRLYMFCGNDIVPYSQSVDIRADQVIDIDATSFHECLF